MDCTFKSSRQSVAHLNYVTASAKSYGKYENESYGKYEKEVAFSSIHLLASYLHIDVTKVKLASLYQIHNI